MSYRSISRFRRGPWTEPEAQCETRGTYFPKNAFMGIRQIVTLWNDVALRCEYIMAEALIRNGNSRENIQELTDIRCDAFEHIANNLMRSLERDRFGNENCPKECVNYVYVLDQFPERWYRPDSPFTQEEQQRLREIEGDPSRINRQRRFRNLGLSSGVRIGVISSVYFDLYAEAQAENRWDEAEANATQTVISCLLDRISNCPGSGSSEESVAIEHVNYLHKRFDAQLIKHEDRWRLQQSRDQMFTVGHYQVWYPFFQIWIRTWSEAINQIEELVLSNVRCAPENRQRDRTEPEKKCLEFTQEPAFG